jgi:hypothetical protein
VIGIYKITNKINGKCYIGQSDNIKRRWKEHKKDAFWTNGNGYDYPLYRAMRKYGIENFTFEIIEECAIDALNELEIFYISKYGSYENGYNQTLGGDSGEHFCKLSQSDIDKIIIILKTTLDTTHSIAQIFGVSYSTIRDINVGKAYKRDNEIYPIRPNIATLYIDDDGEYKPKSERRYYCSVCGCEISGAGNYCHKCSLKLHRKCDRPKPLVLAKMIKDCGFTKTGHHFGVDGNAIKKWCKSYKIPHKRKDLIDWYNEQMGIVDQPKNNTWKRTTEMICPVNQIDKKTGEVLATFKSCREAARAFGASNGDHIGKVCQGLRKSAYGYFWQYA